MRILVTAGPTREFIDPVRFISNPSSGRMGHAIAEAALDAGHEVLLIRGPVSLPPPPRAKVIDVVTAEEMRRAVIGAFPDKDCVIMTAAVADYRPAKILPIKHKKGKGEWLIRLIPTPDILAELGLAKTHQILIGFALEVQNPLENALRKLQAKNLDAIVLNAPAAFGAEVTTVEIITRDGERILLRDRSKREVAEEIIRLASRLSARRAQPLDRR